MYDTDSRDDRPFKRDVKVVLQNRPSSCNLGLEKHSLYWIYSAIVINDTLCNTHVNTIIHS